MPTPVRRQAVQHEGACLLIRFQVSHRLANFDELRTIFTVLRKLGRELKRIEDKAS